MSLISVWKIEFSSGLQRAGHGSRCEAGSLDLSRYAGAMLSRPQSRAVIARRPK
jgi:hypothetical protein